MTENPVCCFCGRICENKWGNNPWPLGGPKDRCCDECDWTVVIPERMKRLRERRERATVPRPEEDE